MSVELRPITQDIEEIPTLNSPTHRFFRGEIIKKIIPVAAVAVAVIVAAAAVYFLVLRRPSFTISVSPSTLTIARGGSDNITFSYDPKVPSNLSMSISPQGMVLPQGTQIGEWVGPPFTFRVIVSENVAPGTYEVRVEGTDMDTGAMATTTFTLIVT